MPPTPASQFPRQLRDGYIRCGIEPPFRLLLAVSGGADSVALLHGTLEIAKQLKDSQVVVAHVNHGLRGSESIADAEFVESLAKQNGLPFELLMLEANHLSAEQGTTLEEAARNARYDFFTEAARKHDLNGVATAHHADDQAETVLHQIIRGSGLRGLRGMQPRRPLADAINLVRPMLRTNRQVILAYLAEEHLSFRTDCSNSDETFTRNRIRQRLLPMLAQDFNSQVERNLVSLAEQSEQALECLDALAEQILDEAILDQQPDAVRMNRNALTRWPVQLVRHALTVLWQRQNWARRKMTREHWQTLTEDVLADSDVRRDFPGGVRADCAREFVRLLRQT